MLPQSIWNELPGKKLCFCVMFTDTVGFFNFVNLNMNLWTVQQTVFLSPCSCVVPVWGWYPIMIPFHVEISPDYLSPSTICIMFFLGSSTWCNVTELQNLPPAVSFKYQLLFQHFVALFHFLCYMCCLHQIQTELFLFFKFASHQFKHLKCFLLSIVNKTWVCGFANHCILVLFTFYTTF